MTQQSVLIVDDMRMVRMRLKIILADLQIGTVLEATDGKQALELLRTNKIDLVLSDWNMPNMTGVELLHAMRADEKLKGTPVVFITSEAQKSSMMEIMALGVSEYVVKPFTDNEVKVKVEAILAKNGNG